MQVFSNNAATTLAAELSAVATSMTVTASTGFASITSPQFELITLESAPATREIVKVTARSGNTWTVERAQEGATAVLWPAGSKVEARATAGTLSGMVQSRSSPIAIGVSSAASGVSAVAIGDYAVAAELRSTAIGQNTQAVAPYSSAVGVGSRARGNNSLALNGGYAYADDSLYTYGYHVIPTDDWNDQWEANSSGAASAFATPTVDLGAVPVWQASATLVHGDIVKPTAGGSVQYRVWTSYADDTWLHLTPDSGTAEPSWPGAGASAWIVPGESAWVGIDWTAGYETTTFPAWLNFHPTDVLFVCQEYAETTGVPTISVGTPSAPASIINAAEVPITAAGQSFRFTLPNPCPGIAEGGSMLIRVDSPANAGKMLGRFLVSGYFIETKSRA